jgi:Domain of unknown function (DUF4388)
MSLSGRLKDLSIPQVLKLLADGSKSGLLTLRIFDAVATGFNKHYLWLDQGAIVSLSGQIDGRDWLTWLGQQEHLGTIAQRQQLQRLNGQLDGYANLGNYLTAQNYLYPTQLQTLFEQRVVQPIGELFNQNNGFFIFNDRFDLPPTESLGLTITARELNLQGLRQLTNWEIYQTELPESHVALLCFESFGSIAGLSPWEKRLLEAADGSQSIAQLAKTWGCELSIVQQAAFGLIVSGLVEELSMATGAVTQTVNQAMPAAAPPTASPIAPVAAPSNSFINHLSQFFNKRLATDPAK